MFTDNGSKDLHLKKDIMRLTDEKDLEVFIVLTPVYEGWPNDKSLVVFDEVAEVKNKLFFSTICRKNGAKGPIVYFIEGRSPSRHNWRFYI